MTVCQWGVQGRRCGDLCHRLCRLLSLAPLRQCGSSALLLRPAPALSLWPRAAGCLHGTLALQCRRKVLLPLAGEQRWQLLLYLSGQGHCLLPELCMPRRRRGLMNPCRALCPHRTRELFICFARCFEDAMHAYMGQLHAQGGVARLLPGK